MVVTRTAAQNRLPAGSRRSEIARGLLAGPRSSRSWAASRWRCAPATARPSLCGDLNVARIAVGLGLALATNRWSDCARVTFVGFADDLSTLAPQRIRHDDDLSAVFELVDSRCRRQHSACAAHGYESVRAGRLAEPDARLWALEFIVLSGVPDEADVKRLSALAADPRNAVGVIVVGDVKDSPARMVAAGDGTLWCGPLGIDVAAHRMSAETYRDALSVFDAEVHGGGGDDPEDLTSAAVAGPGPADLRAVADDMYAAIGRHGSPRGPAAETDALVEALVPGYRRGSAA